MCLHLLHNAKSRTEIKTDVYDVSACHTPSNVNGNIDTSNTVAFHENYDEALLAANHSGALTTDQQGVGEVNYLASDEDDDRTVRAMGQRRMTDVEYRRKVDSLNESPFKKF